MKRCVHSCIAHQRVKIRLSPPQARAAVRNRSGRSCKMGFEKLDDRPLIFGLDGDLRYQGEELANEFDRCRLRGAVAPTRVELQGERYSSPISLLGRTAK